jgi:ribose transport system ATP-binding protein
VDVCKDFVGVRAVDRVSFSVEPGSVHALVGENGAGKSTLMSILAGAVAPSSGTVVVEGAAHASLTPRSARDLGIRLVPQERQVCPELSVGENVLLGHMPKTLGSLGPVNHAAAHREARRRLVQVGLEIDPRTPMRDLTTVQMQAVEIARALSTNARLVIMDEPTASLSGSDIAILFNVIKALRSEGVSFLYVSHHLDEVFELSDTVTVLRDGRHVVTRPTVGLEMDELVALLLGRSLEQVELDKRTHRAGEVVMEARDLRKPRVLHGVSLKVRRSEVLAVTGGVGSGRTQLARALIGAERLEAGSVELVEVGRIKGPAHAVRHGIGFLPEDRKGEGVLSVRDIIDNVGLGWQAANRHVLDLPARRRREAAAQVQRLRVKTPHLYQHARLLSGGNQQKVLLGRWLNVRVRVLVLDGPTEGIDIGSRLEIYQLLRRLADDGVAIVIFSSDLEEVRLIADRAVVLYRGRVAGELSGGEISEERLLALEHGTKAEEVYG